MTRIRPGFENGWGRAGPAGTGAPLDAAFWRLGGRCYRSPGMGLGVARVGR
jgi:hypothetical protein